MPKITEEHREFLTELSKKTEVQVEHIAGCEQCFNFYLFGEKYRCKQYPAKHRIKNSDFTRMLEQLSSESSPVEDVRAMARLLSERFGDPTITDETLDEVTIVPDDEWGIDDEMKGVRRA